jgi:hypothetical protein
VSIDTDIASGSAIHITIAARHIDIAKHVSGLALALCTSDATLVIWLIAATNGRIRVNIRLPVMKYIPSISILVPL